MNLNIPLGIPRCRFTKFLDLVEVLLTGSQNTEDSVGSSVIEFIAMSSLAQPLSDEKRKDCPHFCSMLFSNQLSNLEERPRMLSSVCLVICESALPALSLNCRRNVIRNCQQPQPWAHTNTEERNALGEYFYNFLARPINSKKKKNELNGHY